ncbi:MAG: redoxin domain-containing protein [Candidatus Omnitrophica bacterium]|nr:redoxin domain-containing protein [Candidatus Omnitrophota bacterium]MDD5652891.1 redoxin domain-containing protein [Candidatus Omnitrophota bacterium]
MRRTYLIFFVFFLALLFLSPVSSYTNDTFIGKVAPVFKVMSGDKKTLTLNDLKGKVVVLFYETKSAIEQNRKLKTTLNIFYAEQPNPFKKDIIRIGVIDCHGVFFRGAWEKGLRDNSLKEGITIYGDWDGEMAADYRTTEDVSNVIIIDKKGIVRYYTSGQVEDKNFSIIEKLLDNLVNKK